MVVNQNLIVLDVETGGFLPNQNPLTQIGFIAVDSFNFEVKYKFNSYIKPYDDALFMTKQASELTGITKEKCIQEGRELKEVLDEICQIFKALKVSYYLPILLGHNLSFDTMYLCDVFNRVYGMNSGKGGVNKLYDYVLQTCMDTMIFARHKFINNEVPDFKLNTLASYIGYENTHAHDAFADVETTLELYKYFIGALRSDGKNSYQAAQKKDFKFQF